MNVEPFPYVMVDAINERVQDHTDRVSSAFDQGQQGLALPTESGSSHAFSIAEAPYDCLIFYHDLHDEETQACVERCAGRAICMLEEVRTQ